MTPREVMLEQINHRPTSPVPYTLGFEGDVATRLDEYYGDNSWRTKMVPYMASCGRIDRRRQEAISKTHARDAYGTLWRTDKRPLHLERPAMPKPSFDDYDFPDSDAFKPPDFQANAEKAIADSPDKFSVIHMGWGLWESCWDIRGFENALMDCVAEPEFFGELLDRLTEHYLDQVSWCADIPADAIMFGDDWGDQRGVLIGPERWREFMKPRYAKIWGAAHAQGKIVMCHCCGSVTSIIPDLIEAGLDVLESVQPEAADMNPYELKKQWGDKITFWGGLGSQSTVPFGTPDEIRAEVARLCREMGAGGGYILSPAKALQPETSAENAAAVVEAFTSQEGI